jgi:hypothetical protein
MQNDVTHIDDAIRLFSQTQNPKDLQNAVEQLYKSSFTSDTANKASPSDTSLEKEWLRLFARVDEAIHARENASPRPLVKVSPPADKNGNPSNYLPGVDPESVNDEDVRRRYKAAIAENDKRLLAANEYAQLATIERQATGYFFAWAGSRYQTDTGTRKRIFDEAKKLKLSPERIRKITEATGPED